MSSLITHQIHDILLSFKCDQLASMMNVRLCATLKTMYPDVKLICLYWTDCSLRHTKVDESPLHITANCISQFMCSYQITYIGRTEKKKFPIQISDHISQKLGLEIPHVFINDIPLDLLDGGHNVATLKLFEIINIQTTPQPILTYTETINLKLLEGTSHQSGNLCFSLLN